MARHPRITRLTVWQYRWRLDDMGHDYNGFNQVYQPGNRLQQTSYLFTVETDAGVTGEYAGGNAVSYAQVGMVAQYLLGKNPLERELIYNDLKRALRSAAPTAARSTLRSASQRKNTVSARPPTRRRYVPLRVPNCLAVRSRPPARRAAPSAPRRAVGGL